MKRISLYTLLAPVLLLLAACSSVGDGPSPAGTPAILEPDGSPVPLYAAQDLQVGEVHASDDGRTLTVTYRTDPGWCLMETHLGLGKSVDDLVDRAAHARGRGKGHDMGRGNGHDKGRGNGHDKHHDDPWDDWDDDRYDHGDDDEDDGKDREDGDHDGGVANPAPGQFPYGGEHDCLSEVTYTIDFDDFGFDMDDLQDDHGFGKKIVIAAHAVVSGSEGSSGHSDGGAECTFAMYGVDVAEESGTQRTFYVIDDVPGQVFEPIATFDVGDQVEANYDYAVDALAYDAAAGRLYFAERGAEGSTLHGYDLATGTFFVAGELEGIARGATFHDGGYYYVPDRTSDLIRVEFHADGTISTRTVVESFVPNEALEVVDLAIDDGVLYGSTTGTVDTSVGQFFAFDLASGTFEVHQTYGEGAFHQLAFAADGTLYGTLTLDTVFSRIDTTTGTVTNLDYWPQVAFADLASGEACEDGKTSEPTVDGETRTETAWAGTKPFPNARNWSRYFVYVLDYVADDGGHHGDDEHDEDKDGEDEYKDEDHYDDGDDHHGDEKGDHDDTWSDDHDEHDDHDDDEDDEDDHDDDHDEDEDDADEWKEEDHQDDYDVRLG